MATRDCWRSLVATARTVLAAVAAEGGTITYSELTRRLAADLPDEKGRDLAVLLRSVSLAEVSEGGALLSAVVVRRSGRPGGGWYRLAQEVGRDVSDREEAWRAERELLRARVGPGPP